MGPLEHYQTVLEELRVFKLERLATIARLDREISCEQETVRMELRSHGYLL
jgi:hypothetical protein